MVAAGLRLESIRMAKHKSVGSRNGKGNQAAKAANDNRSRQLNPQHDAYWLGRGYPGRPDKSGGGSARGARKD